MPASKSYLGDSLKGMITTFMAQDKVPIEERKKYGEQMVTVYRMHPIHEALNRAKLIRKTDLVMPDLDSVKAVNLDSRNDLEIGQEYSTIKIVYDDFAVKMKYNILYKDGLPYQVTLPTDFEHVCSLYTTSAEMLPSSHSKFSNAVEESLNNMFAAMNSGGRLSGRALARLMKPLFEINGKGGKTPRMKYF